MQTVNVDALRRGYDALNRGDVSLVLELLDPEIEWHEPAPSPDAGTYTGRDSFERFFRGWIDSQDGKAVRWESSADPDEALSA